MARAVFQCRICHEEEAAAAEGRANSKSIESPCACSGTLKFAHRQCIQRWCDEKGNTTCEICLQNFEPGYAAAPLPKKTRLADVAVTIRESLEVPRQNHELVIAAAEDEIPETHYPECSSASMRTAFCCRSMAVILTLLLLVRHLVSVITGVKDHYAFSLLTLIVLRATGIVLPIYAMLRLFEVIRRCLQQHHQCSENDDSTDEEYEENEQLEPAV